MSDMSVGPVSNADAIVVHLTDAVHEHKIQPGTKLREDEVSDIFGVSRTLVRQALRTMAHDGLVTIERNRGAFVSKPTTKEAREVFEARALLEPQTARAAAERATADHIKALENHIAQEHHALDQGQAGLALKLSGHFHCLIAEIADQKTIEVFLRQLISRSSLVIALYWRRRSALCESHAHHELIDALRRHDVDAAQELMKGHLLDILSQLDLRDMPQNSGSLKDMLAL